MKNNIIDWKLIKAIQVPDEIMVLEAEKWADAMNQFLTKANLRKDNSIFFKIGQNVNGKFQPFDDQDAEQDVLCEVYNFIVKNNLMPGTGFFACQVVDSVEELRSPAFLDA